MRAPDYQAQLQQLLPPGRAWTRGPLAALTGLLGGFGPAYAAVDQRCSDLMDEADPRTTTEMLPDWERIAGLPDPCAGADQTLEQRRQLLLAKLTQVGGQSAAYLGQQAMGVGYPVTISAYAVCDCESDCEASVLEETWAFAFQVAAAATTVDVATCESGCDDRLETYGNAVLECVIDRIKPAHTLAIFTYGP
jgi:uncharacterized protein YmfQ (DUF2313 family)